MEASFHTSLLRSSTGLLMDINTVKLLYRNNGSLATVTKSFNSGKALEIASHKTALFHSFVLCAMYFPVQAINCTLIDLFLFINLTITNCESAKFQSDSIMQQSCFIAN